MSKFSFLAVSFSLALLCFVGCSNPTNQTPATESILNNTEWDCTTVIPYLNNTVTRKQYIEYYFSNTTFDLYQTLTESTDPINYPNKQRGLLFSGTYTISNKTVTIKAKDWTPWSYEIVGNTLVAKDEILTKKK